jgi:hypothetical protein
MKLEHAKGILRAFGDTAAESKKLDDARTAVRKWMDTATPEQFEVAQALINV